MLFGGDVPRPRLRLSIRCLRRSNRIWQRKRRAATNSPDRNISRLLKKRSGTASHAAYQVMTLIKGPITAASTLQELLTAKNIQLGLQPPWTPNAPGPKGFGRVNNWNEYMMKLVNGKFALAYPTSFSVESFVTG